LAKRQAAFSENETRVTVGYSFDQVYSSTGCKTLTKGKSFEF